MAARSARAAAGDAGHRLSTLWKSPRILLNWTRSGTAWMKIGYVEGSNIAIEYRLAENQMIDCRRWRPIWLAVKWP